MVEVSRDATERRLSANQATTRRRQRNFRSGDVLRVQRWPHYRTYIKSSKGLDVRFKDDFEGIDWKRLSGFIALSLRLSRLARLRPIANLVYLQVLSSAQAYRLRQSWQVQHHEVNLGGGSAP